MEHSCVDGSIFVCFLKFVFRAPPVRVMPVASPLSVAKNAYSNGAGSGRCVSTWDVYVRLQKPSFRFLSSSGRSSPSGKRCSLCTSQSTSTPRIHDGRPPTTTLGSMVHHTHCMGG